MCGILASGEQLSNDRPMAYEIVWRLIFIVALLFGLALSSLGFLAMRFPCSEMKISEIGPACVFGDNHASDVDARYQPSMNAYRFSSRLPNPQSAMTPPATANHWPILASTSDA